MNKVIDFPNDEMSIAIKTSKMKNRHGGKCKQNNVK